MTRTTKITLAIALPLLLAGGVAGGIRWSRRDLVTVQTGVAARGDLSAIVTASGEIKPKNYINLGANAQGPITELLVKEGDHVRKGQVVARVERIQPQAELDAQRAAVASSVADASAAEAGLNAQDHVIATAQATLDHSKSDLELARWAWACEKRAALSRTPASAALRLARYCSKSWRAINCSL